MKITNFLENAMIEIDGSAGEGGGQVLRSSLGLSLVTGQGFVIENIRAKRAKGGLLRQHLTAALAAAEISDAQVEGAAMGSTRLSFQPGKVRRGNFKFAVGTAGSATLVLQTVLPALLLGEGETELQLEGGTHNPFAPTFDFLDRCFLPLVNRMGGRVKTGFVCPGFYPAGGGKFSVTVAAVDKLNAIELVERGAVKRKRAEALITGLPVSIAEREINVLRQRLKWEEDCFAVRDFTECHGPGNAITVTVESEALTEVFSGFGHKGVKAEAVAEEVVAEVEGYLASGMPVGEHLADQLLIPMALAGGGRFRTVPLTGHSWTNMEVVGRFLDVSIEAREVEGGHEVVIGAFSSS
jgi:RNA 3'-terminal phosphate cyclase (ATP)